jgi:hypothetical protein
MGEDEPGQPGDKPFITHISNKPTGDIDGGTVPEGNPGTGLVTYLGYERPFGGAVPIRGYIPTSTYEFRVVYRPAGTTRPITPTDAIGIAVVTGDGWQADLLDSSLNCGNIWVPHSSDADGWFNTAAYLSLRADFCSNDLDLTVWDSTNVPNPDGHYVIWLQWRDTALGPVQEEAFDHHVQFDNTAPVIGGFDIPGGACTGYSATSMPITPTALFTDTYFLFYHLRIFGGDPPSAWSYPAVYYPFDPDVVSTGSNGVYAPLHPVDVSDLPPTSIVDCCYGIRLWVEDRAIIGTFHSSIDDVQYEYGHQDLLEITFRYTP